MTESSQYGDTLIDLWVAQRAYNRKIRETKTPWMTEMPEVYWTKEYVLGLVTEVDEVLKEMNWKNHRSQETEMVMRNLALELADMTKYVLSLWEVWGFDLKDVLNITLEKSWWVEDRTNMELTPEPSNRKIVVTDLDGTLANWRQSFLNWLHAEKNIGPMVDPVTSLSMDTDLAWAYPEYASWKDEFESTRGYAHLEPYADGIRTIAALKNLDAYIIVYTARPEHKFKQVWWDTLSWLKGYGIAPDKLYVGGEPRVLLAHRLQKNNQVILLDDDPGLILRAALAGIKVFARRKPYNARLMHENITWVEKYTDIEPEDYFGKTEGVEP